MTAYCGVEEGRSHLHVRRGGRPVGGGVRTIVKTDEQVRSELDIALSQAISSVMSEKRPTKCFLCLRKPQLPIRERIRDYANPGSLSRHFHNTHVMKLHAKEPRDCGVCNVKLLHRMHLLNHAERFHGTVSRRNV